ncbi:hypothetical protein PR048_031693 [Dryococelus australis]|uniref:Uncharacterized protein n=1 Tax=Dryococelus australis TaxID=614101 RepID=A0ABQ9G6N0_9NEOP|nr:hypothetical protein PR048_031693 [Dryococelus australis]
MASLRVTLSRVRNTWSFRAPYYAFLLLPLKRSGWTGWAEPTDVNARCHTSERNNRIPSNRSGTKASYDTGLMLLAGTLTSADEEKCQLVEDMSGFVYVFRLALHLDYNFYVAIDDYLTLCTPHDMVGREAMRVGICMGRSSQEDLGGTFTTFPDLSKNPQVERKERRSAGWALIANSEWLFTARFLRAKSEIEVSMEPHRNERVGGNGRFPTKLVDRWHSPAQFPVAKMISRSYRNPGLISSKTALKYWLGNVLICHQECRECYYLCRLPCIFPGSQYTGIGPVGASQGHCLCNSSTGHSSASPASGMRLPEDARVFLHAVDIWSTFVECRITAEIYATPGSYGIRNIFPCKSAVGSEKCRAGLVS